MNKKLFFLLTLLIGLGISFNVLALELWWPESPLSRIKLEDTSTLTDMVRYFYEWGLFIGGLAVLVSLIIGGFLYLTSMGNPARMSEAKDRIFSALTGLVLLFSIYLILNTINPELTILSIPELETPSETLSPITVSSLLNPCQKASLYDQNGNHIADLIAGEELCYVEEECGVGCYVNKIEIEGVCTLQLWSETGCTGNYFSLSSSDSNIKEKYGLEVKGVKDISTSSISHTITTPACPPFKCLSCF